MFHGLLRTVGDLQVIWALPRLSRLASICEGFRKSGPKIDHICHDACYEDFQNGRLISGNTMYVLGLFGCARSFGLAHVSCGTRGIRSCSFLNKSASGDEGKKDRETPGQTKKKRTKKNMGRRRRRGGEKGKREREREM